jgi:hypothetical protein
MITIAQARQQLGLPPLPPLSAPMAFPDLDKAHQERVAKMLREQADEIGKIRTDGENRKARQQQHQAYLLEESRLHKQLLREKAIVRRKVDDDVELTSRRNHRHFKKELGLPLSLIDCQQLVDEWSATPTPNDPVVQILAPWLEQIEREHSIDVRQCAAPELANGSASRKGRYIVVGKRETVEECETEAHEVGHLLHEELDDYREVPGELGKTISVPAELAAWKWVLTNIPAWNESMHSHMSRAINSYRRYANDAEKVEIDRLCSPLSLRQTTLRIAA